MLIPGAAAIPTAVAATVPQSSVFRQRKLRRLHAQSGQLPTGPDRGRMRCTRRHGVPRKRRWPQNRRLCSWRLLRNQRRDKRPRLRRQETAEIPLQPRHGPCCSGSTSRPRGTSSLQRGMSRGTSSRRGTRSGMNLRGMNPEGTSATPLGSSSRMMSSDPARPGRCQPLVFCMGIEPCIFRHPLC